MAALEKDIFLLKEEIEELNDEKAAILNWSKNQKPLAVVSVSGPIHAGTIISGIHTQTKIRETCRHVRIHEIKNTDPDTSVEWEMRISPFKNK